MDSSFYEKLMKRLEMGSNYVITTHLNPDPDGVGAELGLRYLLMQMGKEVRVINNDPLSPKFHFLDPDRICKSIDDVNDESLTSGRCSVLMVDTYDVERCGRVKRLIKPDRSNLTILDHHDCPEPIQNYHFLNANKSSTAEMVFELIQHSGFTPVPGEVATAIYTGIVVDTGHFRYKKTSPETHQAAKELLSMGVEPHKVHESLSSQSPVGRLFLKRELYNSLQIEDGVAWIYIHKHEVERLGLTLDDLDGIVNELIEPEQIKVGILFTQREENKTKVSLRTKSWVNILPAVEPYGGGGHKNACGATLFHPLDDAMDEFLPRVFDVIDSL